MKNNKGVTLISLISSVILLIILAAVTIVTSMNAYRQMEFEGAKAEIEEVQKIVDEIAVDYQNYLKEQFPSSVKYVDYFESRYNATNFSDKLLSNCLSNAEKVLEKYPSLETSENSDMIFYFTADDLNKYFDLKGINDVIIDFSTRTVYSVNGIIDSDDKNKIYYTASEWGANVVIKSTSVEKDIPTIEVEQISKRDNTYDVNLIITPAMREISEVYAYKDEKFVKIDNFRNITDENDSAKTVIRVTVEGSGDYQFKIVDSLKNSYNSVEATIE